MLFLDEPTTGLDPRSRNELWDMVRGLLADGVTVLLTTQYLEEADQLADEIAVIDHGRVIATGTPDELKAKTGGQVLEVRAGRPTAARRRVLAASLARAARTPPRSGRPCHVPVTDPAVLPAVVRRLDDAGVVVGRARAAHVQPGRGVPVPHRAPARGHDAADGDGHVTGEAPA